MKSLRYDGDRASLSSFPQSPSVDKKAPTSPIRKWGIRATALVLSLLMLVYGLLAIDTGIVNFKSAGDAGVAAKRLQMMKDADAGRPVDPKEVLNTSGPLLYLIGKTSSPTYAYGKSGINEQFAHYAAMPKSNGVALSFHNIMGGACMLVGALQFWPSLRRRWPKVHRGMGLFYVCTAQIAMLASIFYLLRTPVDNIYDQLTFYVGLWSLALGVSASLWMAMLAAWRKQFAQHQGWMAMSYAMLLTAPLQRLGWLGFGMVAPELRQLEGNFAVSDTLIPLCLLTGYGVFTINRWLQDRKPQATARQQDRSPTPIWGKALATACMALLTLSGYQVLKGTWLANSAFESISGASLSLIPPGVVQMYERVIFAPENTRWLFVIAYLAGTAAGIQMLWSTFLRGPTHVNASSRTAWVAVLSGGIVGTIALSWGWKMGLPSFSTIDGGTFYIFGGCVTLSFTLLTAFALFKNELGWLREWRIFLMAALVGLNGLELFLPILTHLNVPQRFIETGHAYRLAYGLPWAYVAFAAFAASIYGEETKNRLAR